MRRPRSLHPLLKERIEVWKGEELGKLDWRPTPECRSRQKQLKKEPQLDFEPPGHSDKGYLTDKKNSINQAAEKIEAILAEPCFTKWLEALPSNSMRRMAAQYLATCIIRLVYIRPEILGSYEREAYSERLKKSKRLLKKVKKCKSQFFDLWKFFQDDRLYQASREMDLLYRSVSSWQIEASPPKGKPEAPWRRWIEELYAWVSEINSRLGPTCVGGEYVPLEIPLKAIERILSRVVPESDRKFDPLTPGRNSDIRKHARYCQQIYGPPPQPKLRESGGEPPPPDQQSQVTIKA
jgi:hypothetical protein